MLVRYRKCKEEKILNNIKYLLISKLRAREKLRANIHFNMRAKEEERKRNEFACLHFNNNQPARLQKENAKSTEEEEAGTEKKSEWTSKWKSGAKSGNSSTDDGQWRGIKGERRQENNSQIKTKVRTGQSSARQVKMKGQDTK